MFSDDYNNAHPKLAPNSSSDVKVIEITPYLGENGTGPFTTIVAATVRMHSDAIFSPSVLLE